MPFHWQRLVVAAAICAAAPASAWSAAQSSNRSHAACPNERANGVIAMSADGSSAAFLLLELSRSSGGFAP